jgi:hypothetical protein
MHAKLADQGCGLIHRNDIVLEALHEHGDAQAARASYGRSDIDWMCQSTVDQTRSA